MSRKRIKKGPKKEPQARVVRVPVREQMCYMRKLKKLQRDVEEQDLPTQHPIESPWVEDEGS